MDECALPQVRYAQNGIATTLLTAIMVSPMLYMKTEASCSEGSQDRPPTSAS